jgi:hypothetical protein
VALCHHPVNVMMHLGTKRIAVYYNIAAAEEEKRQDPVKTDM